LVKFEADNCFAMFEDVPSAVEAAIALNTAFTAINQFTDDEFDIRVSIGIDFGEVLLIGGPDYFGDTVNRASKLGEDVAGPGDILLAEAALAQYPPDRQPAGERLDLSLSGLHLSALKLHYR
jgi:class 3 adenylate cyclase